MLFESLQRPWWWYIIYLLCLCVFLLSLQAKLSPYGTALHAQTASAFSKLWANGAKMDIRSPGAAALFFALAVLLMFVRYLGLHREALALRADFTGPMLSGGPGFQPHRFLRPPPTL